MKVRLNSGIFRMTNRIDIKENMLLHTDAALLDLLLYDNTTKRNIIWATDNYEKFGIPYAYSAQIYPELITDKNGNIIRPRVAKTLEEQTARVKDKAEVFTPSWICNAQNNLVDSAWFGRTNVFNKERNQSWVVNSKRIEFPTKKTWQDYVLANRMEVSCGEAPYLVSRYDTITGKPILLKRRIGLLDRKLRVVSENTENVEIGINGRSSHSKACMDLSGRAITSFWQEKTFFIHFATTTRRNSEVPRQGSKCWKSPI